MSRYRFIDAERTQHPVRHLCQVLGVPASGYCAWQTGQQRAVAKFWKLSGVEAVAETQAYCVYVLEVPLPTMTSRAIRCAVEAIEGENNDFASADWGLDRSAMNDAGKRNSKQFSE